MSKWSAACSSKPRTRKRGAFKKKGAGSSHLLPSPCTHPARSSSNQLASRDAALIAEQLEQQLSALKSTCASLEAEVATQRAFAESSAEAADAASARAHSSLTQYIALKKKMKDELPRLIDELSKAQAERDSAVRQRQTDAANISVERNMMSSKLAGAYTLSRFILTASQSQCSLHLSNKRCCCTCRSAAAAVRVSCGRPHSNPRA